MKKLTSHSTLFALLLTPVASFGQPFFYRTGAYNYQPRFERNCLSTWEVNVQGGGTRTGYESEYAPGGAKSKVIVAPTAPTETHGNNTQNSNVLNLYGWQNFQFLGTNIVGNPGTDIYNQNLVVLDQLPQNGTFGWVQYAGKFSYIEADLYFAQNFCKGFFADLNIPIVHTKISGVGFTDMSPTNAGFPNVNDPNWQFLINPTNLATTLAEYSLTASDYSKSGVGDIEIYLGWTMNKEDICDSIDFLDATIKVGFNVPSGYQKNQNQAFSLAAGYDGHFGVPVSFDAAIGFLEWVTVGAHVGGTFFTSKTKSYRMKTSVAQNGYIKLGLGQAKMDMGNLFDAGAYLKADHIFKGLSLMFGYVYARQSKSTLTPTNTVQFPTAIVNGDNMLYSWYSHALSGSVEYDFAREGKRFNPVIGIFYSQPIAGKRVFNTKTGGGYAGVNVAWDF